MPDTFEYRVRDQAGKVVTGTLVAENEQLVVHRLREMGYVPLKVGVQNLGMKREFNFRQKAKLKDLAVFSRQFATMVNSGLPILRALSILEQQTESRMLTQAVGKIRIDIERGESVSAAMAKHPKTFSRLYISMVRAGETGGILDAVLER